MDNTKKSIEQVISELKIKVVIDKKKLVEAILDPQSFFVFQQPFQPLT